MNEREVQIELREICCEDAGVLMELNNNEAVSKFVVGNPQKVSIQQQLEWMERIKTEKNTKRWMIVYNDEPVGTVIINSIDYSNGVGNMNIKVLPTHQGKGIARIALLMACDIAFDDMKLSCLTASILPYNTKSYKLFRRVGFKEDGILRSRIVKNGVRYDLINLSFLESERVGKEDACERSGQ